MEEDGEIQVLPGLEVNLLTELDEDGVSDLLASLGYPFYEAQVKGKVPSIYALSFTKLIVLFLLEHGITGEILVHLDHEALKDVGIHSVGQRLAILKEVYRLKVQQNVAVEEGHYVPPCKST